MQPAQPFITRVEVVGGEFVYAITADTERGGFDLCPADACAVGQPRQPRESGESGQPGESSEPRKPRQSSETRQPRKPHQSSEPGQPREPSEPDQPNLFALRDDFDHPIVGQYLSFARRHGIEIGGFEFIEQADGRMVTYDVNTTTNYNAGIEAAARRSARRSALREVARFLGRLLAEEAGKGAG